MSLTKRIKGNYLIETVDPAASGDTITLKPASFDVNNPGVVIIDGDLTVKGTTTTIESVDTEIVDNTIILNSGELGIGVGGGTGTSGLEIDRGSLDPAGIHFDENDDTWKINDGDGIWAAITTGGAGLTALVNDLDPHLGADLIVAGFAITSEPASDLDVIIDADGIGVVKINTELTLIELSKGVASVAVIPGNSSGYTTGDALTIGAPVHDDGVQATGTVVVASPVGALEEGTTVFVLTGTETGAGAVFAGVALEGNISGSGAIGTITTNGGADYSTTVLEITTPGSGYANGETITVLGTAVGGATTLNDLTITITGPVALGAITGTTITVAGSGYTNAPTITALTGTLGTGTLTAVLTTATLPAPLAGYSKIYATTAGDGGSGLYYVDEEGTSDELVSRAKAILYGLIF